MPKNCSNWNTRDLPRPLLLSAPSHVAACHPDRSGGISPLFLPSRHPDPVGASRRQRSGMADRWYTAPMAAKKKTKKKHTKRTTRKKLKPVKKALKAKLAKKGETRKKKLAAKKAASKKAGAKTKAGGKKKAVGKTARAAKKPVSGKSQTVGTVAI